ncbi:MAG: hypothetical protein LBR22_11230 [Desulfovibrio sp.]|jgi:hypothetical protein|nr:hypothetical protein [Desulfovibrio sp.]
MGPKAVSKIRSMDCGCFVADGVLPADKRWSVFVLDMIVAHFVFIVLRFINGMQFYEAKYAIVYF